MTQPTPGSLLSHQIREWLSTREFTTMSHSGDRTQYYMTNLDLKVGVTVIEQEDGDVKCEVSSSIFAQCAVLSTHVVFRTMTNVEERLTRIIGYFNMVNLAVIDTGCGVLTIGDVGIDGELIHMTDDELTAARMLVDHAATTADGPVMLGAITLLQDKFS